MSERLLNPSHPDGSALEPTTSQLQRVLREVDRRAGCLRTLAKCCDRTLQCQLIIFYLAGLIATIVVGAIYIWGAVGASCTGCPSAPSASDAISNSQNAMVAAILMFALLTFFTGLVATCRGTDRGACCCCDGLRLAAVLLGVGVVAQGFFIGVVMLHFTQFHSSHGDRFLSHLSAASCSTYDNLVGRNGTGAAAATVSTPLPHGCLAC
eukprot:COSAG01_NODE_5390_length_4291_cov_3.107109_5_plen_209_part_00